MFNYKTTFQYYEQRLSNKNHNNKTIGNTDRTSVIINKKTQRDCRGW